MIKITFPDGSNKKFKECSGLDIANSISEGLGREAVAIEVDGVVQDLNIDITKNAKIRIITFV